MTWNPLKRLSAPRGSLGHNAAFSMEEREVENQILYLNNLIEVSKRLHKDSKKYTENVHTVSSSELKLAHDLSQTPVCHDEEQLRNLLEEYDTVVIQSQLHCNELIMILQKTLVEPMKKYNNILHDVQSSLRKRDTAMQECQKYQAKVEKLQDKEKTGSNIAKLETNKKALVNARKELSDINQELLQEFPKVFAARLSYFQPSLEAIIHAEVNYSGEFSKLFRELMRSPHVKSSLSDDAYEHNIQQQLAEIKALSIVD